MQTLDLLVLGKPAARHFLILEVKKRFHEYKGKVSFWVYRCECFTLGSGASQKGPDIAHFFRHKPSSHHPTALRRLVTGNALMGHTDRYIWIFSQENTMSLLWTGAGFILQVVYSI